MNSSGKIKLIFCDLSFGRNIVIKTAIKPAPCLMIATNTDSFTQNDYDYYYFVTITSFPINNPEAIEFICKKAVPSIRPDQLIICDKIKLRRTSATYNDSDIQLRFTLFRAKSNHNEYSEEVDSITSHPFRVFSHTKYLKQANQSLPSAISDKPTLIELIPSHILQIVRSNNSKLVIIGSNFNLSNVSVCLSNGADIYSECTVISDWSVNTLLIFSIDSTVLRSGDWKVAVMNEFGWSNYLNLRID